MVIIEHSKIEVDTLIQIVKLKQSAWPKYSIYEHMKWITENLKPDDLHCYLDDFSAYLNLINIDIELDGIKQSAVGFGNLCSGLNRGSGALLMKQVIAKQTLPMLSFCNYDLVSYYKHFGWEFIHRSRCEFTIDLIDLRVMYYGSRFNKIKYTGNKF
jgi:hypothetical protein